MKSLEEVLLSTLSFFDPMSKEQILLQMDESSIDVQERLTVKDLEDELIRLVKLKKLKKSKKNKDVVWIRRFPKKPLLRRFLDLWTR